MNLHFSRYALLLFVLASLICTPVSFASASKLTANKDNNLMFEPVFAIKYSPAEVRFDPAPDEIYQCEGLRTPRTKLSLFGKAVKNGVGFYYVYGLVEVDHGAGPTGEFEAQHDDGTIVVVSPMGCRDISAGYAWTPDATFRRNASDLGITDDVVAALLSDAVDREVKAFGGVSNFLARVKASGVKESYLQRPLQAKLKALRKGAMDNMPKTK